MSGSLARLLLLERTAARQASLDHLREARAALDAAEAEAVALAASLARAHEIGRAHV